MNAQQLRNSILQQAIQGKLVPQDPADEPASVLLQRIRKEKERLVKEGKLKKKDLESKPIEEDEIPFEIPMGWEWGRIKEVFSMQAGKFVSASDISDEQTNENIFPCYGGNGLRGYVKKFNNDGYFTLVGRQGALCGNVQIAKGKFYATEHAVVTDGFGLTDVKWAYYFLTALKLNQYATATAQPGLAVSNVLEVLLPLPPLAEQRRIVAKIEELMPLVERYGKAQQALDLLNESLPARLRQSILQEAIQGRLVPQDPKEEPAEITLEKYGYNCKNRAGRGKEFTQELFDIPETWVWAPFKKCADVLYGYPFDSQKFSETKLGMPMIRIRDVLPGVTKTYTSETADEKYIIKKGDMLVGMDGNFNVNYWKGDDSYLNQRVCKIVANEKVVLQKYLFYYLPIIFEEISSNVSYCTVKHLADTHFNLMRIPLPPLSEQKRIVAKVEELFGTIRL